MQVSRWLLAVVLGIAALSGIFYALTIPPWDLYDEGTHLAYALTLRDEQRIPHLDEYTRRDVVSSEIETRRWERFRIGQPDTSSLEAMGLGGRLYQGYQPPLYYLLILPATMIAPNDVETTMYLARLFFGPALLAGLTAITWALARVWFPSAGPWTAFVAAFGVAIVPAAGEAAGRVNNDLLAATLIAASVLLTCLLARNPRLDVALALGLISALAILTKANGMLLLPVLVAVLGVLWWRGDLDFGTAVLSAGPPLLAAIAWTVWTYIRYGVWTGSVAFLGFARPFEPMGLIEFFDALWFNAWSSYWATHGGGWLQIITGLILLGGVAVGVAGLRRVEVHTAVWLVTGVMTAGMLLMLWYGNASGLVYPQGRILLPLIPLASVLIARGWSAMGGRGGLVVLMGVYLLLAVGFVFGWYLPFFY